MKKSKKRSSSKIFWLFWLTLVIFSSIIRVECISCSSKYTGKEKEIVGQILSYKIDGDKLSLTLKGKEKIIATYYIKSKKEKELLEESLQIGDMYLFLGTLKVPNHHTIPNTFDYKKYLNRQKIFYLLQVDEMKLHAKNKSILLKVKNIIDRRIKKIDDSGYLSTFILGDKNDLNDGVMSDFQTNGISHLFAISGMHVSLFASILLLLLKRFGERFSRIFTIIFLWLYAILIGLPISIVRATLNFSLLNLAKIFSIPMKPVYVSLIAASIILIIYPVALFQVGFQFSFLTSFGLLYYADSFQDKNFLQASWRTSCIAFACSLPITIYHFYQINCLSVFWNIIFIPLVSFIIYPLSLICFIFPCFIPIFHFFILLLEGLNHICAKFHFLSFLIPKIPLALLIGLLVLLFISKYCRKCWILFGIVIITWMVLPYCNPSAYVYFLDVGQGDSALVITPYRKKVYLIDTGGEITYTKEDWAKRKKEYYVSDNTITFLKSLGIPKIDTIFLSHGDADHAKDALHILENYAVGNIVLNKGSYNTIEKQIIKQYEQKIVEQNEIFDAVRIWNPYDYHDENDNSMYLLFQFYDKKILFTGDGSKKTESAFMKENKDHIDILKVGHHGSNTSSDITFLKTLSPSYAVISVGENNKYHHPSKETINNLETLGIPYFETRKEGTIEFQISPKKVTKSSFTP